MQRYVFTYNFNKTQDPVVKMARETQQYIAFDVVMAVQASAHGAIYNTMSNINNDLMIAANQAEVESVDELAVQNSKLAE
jgi:hypothetical protein